MATERITRLARLGCLTLLALGAASPLSAQDPRLAGRLPASVARVVQQLVDSAVRAALPAEPLVQKALEGESKGADSATIVRAVFALEGRLGTARRSLGGGATDAELVAGAAALRSGASPATLAALHDLRPGQRLVVPLSVLADLLVAGVPPERAWNSLREVARTGANDAAFLSLRDRLTEGAQPAGGLPPEVQRPPVDAPAPPRPVRP